MVRRVFQRQLAPVEILSKSSLEMLERGWKRIVSEIGIEFDHEGALELFRAARAEGRGPGRPSRPRVHARADREDPEVVHLALAQPRARHRLRARPDGVPAGQLGALRARGRAALRGHVRRVPALQPADVRHRRARLARLPVVRPHRRRHRDASPEPPARAVRETRTSRSSPRAFDGTGAADSIDDGRDRGRQPRGADRAARPSPASSTATRRCATTSACSSRCSRWRAPGRS